MFGYYYKWVKFFFKIWYNKNWINNTIEGKEYLKKLFVNNGHLSIKMGQFLHSNSMLSDVYKEKNNIFEELLSNNKSHTLDQTKKILGNYINNIEYIEENVLGSGSFAQVHKCKLKHDDNIYVLKILHPEILKVSEEVKYLKKIIYYILYFNKFNIDFDIFFNDIIKSYNLTNEASNIKLFYDIYKDLDEIEIPKVIYSNDNFIIMTYIEGKLFYNVTDFDIKKKATFLVCSNYLYSYSNFCISHGDLHAGNILVKDNGNIGLIDFGIIVNDKINLNTNNLILYDYAKWLKNKTYEDGKIFLKKIIVDSEQKKISYIKLIKLITEGFKDLNSSNHNNKFILKIIQEKIKSLNIELKGNLLNFLLQQFILEDFLRKVCNLDNRDFLLTVTDFMKNHYFFKEKCKVFIENMNKLDN